MNLFRMLKKLASPKSTNNSGKSDIVSDNGKGTANTCSARLNDINSYLSMVPVSNVPERTKSTTEGDRPKLAKDAKRYRNEHSTNKMSDEAQLGHKPERGETTESEQQLRDKIKKIEQIVASNATAAGTETMGCREIEHQEQLDALAEKYRANMNGQHKKHERVIVELIKSHEAEVAAYKKRVRALMSDLLSRADDFRPATDEVLRLKLGFICSRIHTLSFLPNLLNVRPASTSLPQSGSAGPAIVSIAHPACTTAIQQLRGLDPTGFVARHSPHDAGVFLSSLVWQILIEAFFSSPYGFGLLGPDESCNPGRRQLLDVHRTWSRLYVGGRDSQNVDELAIYSHDPYANHMRSALFQSFLPVVHADKAAQKKKSAIGLEPRMHQPMRPNAPEDGGLGGRGGRSDNSSPGLEANVATLYRQHCDNVIHKIQELLNSITSNNTHPGILDLVTAIVNRTAELSLDCGVQRARVQLIVPKHNDAVTEGTDYHNYLGCHDDGAKDMAVDLVVEPGLVSIGDGRQNMTYRRVLEPCRVYPFTDEAMDG